MRKAVLIGALGFLGLLTHPAISQAQDPFTLYPENYKVLFENDRVRVLDFRLAKGATEKTHQHPA